MITRAKSQRGEGTLAEYNPEIGKRRIFPRSKMAAEEGQTKFDGEALQKAFLDMKSMVDVLFQERQERQKHEKGGASKLEDKGKRLGGGGSPPKTPPSPLSSPSPSSSPSSFVNPFKGTHKPVIKLDVKFELPKYSGELSAEKLDDWIQQVEVYCRIQGLLEDASRIQLATLRLGGTALTWWESRTQEELARHGRVRMSWMEFVAALKEQFYPLGHMQQLTMN